ncbi:MAG: hypothetical protein K8H84_00565 [Sulfuricella denitrificans]|nr:hypothetical protein [Sulfuricella denitrificans]
MSKHETIESAPPVAVKIVGENEQKQIIYADRIIGAGFGPGVSKLTLAMEVSAGVVTPSATLIMPTPALLEGLTAILNTINGPDEIKKNLIDALDAFKEQLSSNN